MDYEKLAQTALRLLSENGRAVAFVRQSLPPTGPMDPTQPGQSPAEEQLPALGVFTDYTKSEIDGTTVKRGDKRLVVSALDVPADDLATYTHVLDGAKRWSVVRVDDVKPGATPLVHFVQARL